MDNGDRTSGLGERIEALIKVAGGVSSLSRRAGVSRASIDKWRNESADPSRSNLIALADACNVSLLWLATGAGPMDARLGVGAQIESDVVEVPRYDVTASAGHGRLIDAENQKGSIPFRPEFFMKNLQRSAKDMVILDAAGDSMEPTMEDCDLLMVDRSTATEPVSSGIYAFTLGDTAYVKRLMTAPSGIIARSDNRDYPDFTITPADRDAFHLIGRVVWIGRML